MFQIRPVALGHLEARLIVDADFRITSLQVLLPSEEGKTCMSEVPLYFYERGTPVLV